MRTEPPSRLSHIALFTGFFQAGIFGFGGVLPMARRIVVDERRWLTQTEFNELFSLCQSLPGANITNLTAALGMRHQGVTGAAAALAGLLAAPMAIIMVLSALYGRFGTLPPVRHALAGLAAAAAGLLLGTAGKIATPVWKNSRNIAISVLVLALVLALHQSLPLTMLLVLPLSLYLSWRRTP
jgi:chromate transporter